MTGDDGVVGLLVSVIVWDMSSLLSCFVGDSVLLSFSGGSCLCFLLSDDCEPCHSVKDLGANIIAHLWSGSQLLERLLPGRLPAIT